MTFNTTELVMLVLALVAGWFFGLASRSGGSQWRDRYTAERDAHALARKDADTRVADANRRADAAEQERDRLARAAPVTAQTVAPAPVAATAPRVVGTGRTETIAPISTTTYAPVRTDPSA